MGKTIFKMLERFVVFSLVIFFSVFIFNVVDVQMFYNSTESTRHAIIRAAVSCYALEGRYPPDLPYLEQSYGLIIDYDRYAVYYSTFGSNIMPDVDVFPMNP